MTEFTQPFPWPVLAAGCALAALVVVASHLWAKGSKAGRGGPIHAVLVLLRVMAMAILVVCLLDPHRVERIAHPRRVRMAVLVDTSRSMATADVPGGRLAASQAWLEALRPQLADGVELVPLSFDESVRPWTNPPPSGAAQAPAGPSSAIAAALDAVASDRSDEPLTGVLLLSDGIETTLQSPEDAARRLRRRGIPVHAVVTGTTNELRDVVVESLQVRRTAANDAPTKVRLDVRSPGFGSRDVQLQVRRGGDVIATRAARLTGQPQSLEIDFTPRGSGFQVFDVGVAPLEGEWLASNNRRRFGLDVVDPKLRVLYMEGTPQQNSSPQPEWKYLKDALQSDKRIVVKVLYRQFGNNGQVLNTVDADPETGERAWPVEHPTEGFPRTLEGLLEYDVVIHSDIKRESFSEEQLSHIAALVEQHGGGFVMIGGNSAFGRGGYHQTVLDRIIPLAMEGAYDNEARAIQLHVLSNAWTHPLIAFGASPQETRRIWTARFPTLYGFNRVERAKPAATVLAQGLGDDAILLAVQQAGRGRTMAFTSDTTRSWGRDFETLWGEPLRPNTEVTEDNCDSRHYRAFWVNAVRWLAAGKASRTNPPVQVELSQAQGSPGDPLDVTVRVLDAQRRPVAAAEVALALVNAAGSNVVARAAYDPAQRLHRARLAFPTAGTHVVNAIATVAGKRLGEDKQLLVSEVVDREMSDLRARPDVMSAIARASGGIVFDVRTNPPAAVARALAEVPPPAVELRRHPLWDRWPWLAAVLGLLCTEWSLRRWRGLA